MAPGGPEQLKESWPAPFTGAGYVCYSRSMSRRQEDQRPTSEQLAKAAIKAQLKIAEDRRPGGAHDMVAALPSNLQKVVMDVVNET